MSDPDQEPLKKLPDPDPAVQKSTDPTGYGSGSSSLNFSLGIKKRRRGGGSICSSVKNMDSFG